MTRLRNVVRGHRVGAVVAVVAAIALVGGGTAAALALNQGGGSAPDGSSALAPASTTSTTLPIATQPPPATVPSTTMAPSHPPAATSPAPSVIPPIADISQIISDTCLYSHQANDDPILEPGRPGQSMDHDFFGNTTTSATSTAASLVGRSNTCSASADASAYWTPVLYQEGIAVTPTHNLIYWSGLQAKGPTVTAPPAGLELIAGDESAMSPQSTKVVGWRCASQLAQKVSPTPVDCPGTKGMELRIIFPSCWNGQTLNGASQTNAAYPVAHDICPVGYPVRIPAIVFHVVYPVTSAAGLTLSMGPGQQGSTDTAHGDFINGWNQSVLTGLINGCSGSAHTCGHVLGTQVRPRTQ